MGFDELIALEETLKSPVRALVWEVEVAITLHHEIALEALHRRSSEEIKGNHKHVE